MSEQSQIDAQVAQLVANNEALATALQAISAEIVALSNANPTLDLSGLVAAVEATGVQVQAAQSEASSVGPPPQPPAS